MVGVLDLNVSSNSDIGMSGSFVPWAKLYDGFFFTPEHQPCANRFNMEKSLQDEDGFRRFTIPLDSFENYIKLLNNGDKFKDLLKPEKIEIVEKTPEELARKSRRQRIDYQEESIEEEVVKPDEEATESEEEVENGSE